MKTNIYYIVPAGALGSFISSSICVWLDADTRMTFMDLAMPFCMAFSSGVGFLFAAIIYQRLGKRNNAVTGDKL